MAGYCKGICNDHPDIARYGGRYPADKNHNIYSEDVKRCSKCAKFFKNQTGKNRCFCCKHPMRLYARRSAKRQERIEARAKRIE